MDVKGRMYEVFQKSKLKQLEFAERIGISQAYVSRIFREGSNENPSDQLIKIICSEFKVNEEWLRNGTGEMFVADEWDAYAILHDMSGLERKALKAYMSIDRNIRQTALEQFMAFFAEQEQAATAEEEIQARVKQYEQELIDEHRKKTSSASTVSNEAG